MSRIDRIELRGYASVALILVAVILVAILAWPSAGWSRPAARACRVQPAVVKALLQNWANKLAQSSPGDPSPVVGTYENGAVLVPTCANGPYSGRDKITDYFKGFLAHQPTVVFDMAGAKIGGDCHIAFASGLYSFTLHHGGVAPLPVLPARYTYIFAHNIHGSWLIAQHHSSLEPEFRGRVPALGS